MSLMPSWALSGQAVDGIGDAHLSSGIHYRILINPLLGLPVVPLSVLVGNLGTGAKGYTRRDVTWVDSNGTLLTAPFTVTPDNPVTGYLPLGQTCCWAGLEGKATSVVGPVVRPPVVRPPVVVPPVVVAPVPDPPGPLRPGGIRPPVGGGSGRDASRINVPVPDPAGPVGGRAEIARPDLDRLDIRVLDRLRARQLPFRLEGVVATPYGDAPVARRSSEPYHVYASHIERLVVRGSGTVTGVSWLPAGNVGQLAPLRMAPLPSKSGARYAGPPDGPDEGIARVKRGAPQRMGMHESVLAGAAAACDPATAADEIGRVQALIPGPEKTLDRLINDLAAPQQQLTAPETVFDENGNALGTSNRLILQEFLQGIVDPGMARWLGALDVDDERRAQPGDVLVYVVEGLFAPDAASIQKLGLTGTLGAASTFAEGTAALQELIGNNDKFAQFLGEVKAMGQGTYVVGRVVLAVTVGSPLDVPLAPTMSAPTSGSWLPATGTDRSPRADRGPRGPRARSRPVQRDRPARGRSTARHATRRSPRDDGCCSPHRPTRPRSRPPAACSPTGSSTSATASGRSRRPTGSAAGPRERPPRSGRPAGLGRRVRRSPSPPRRPRWQRPCRPGHWPGSVRIEVSVPPVAGLPAGGRLLASLRLTVTTGSGAPVLTDHPVSSPTRSAGGHGRDGPGSDARPDRGRHRDWSRHAGATPRESTPIRPTPRPRRCTIRGRPRRWSCPPTLVYTARPDATGRSRATLTWAPGAGQSSYRVFFADETTLRAKLEEVAAGTVATGDAGQAPSVPQAQTILTALDAAADAPARGSSVGRASHPPAPALVAPADRRAAAAAVDRERRVHPRRVRVADRARPLPGGRGERGQRGVGLRDLPDAAPRSSQPPGSADARCLGDAHQDRRRPAAPASP